MGGTCVKLPMAVEWEDFTQISPRERERGGGGRREIGCGKGEMMMMFSLLLQFVIHLATGKRNSILLSPAAFTRHFKHPWRPWQDPFLAKWFEEMGKGKEGEEIRRRKCCLNRTSSVLVESKRQTDRPNNDRT